MNNSKIHTPRSFVEKIYLKGEHYPYLKVGMKRVNLTPTVEVVMGETMKTENPPVYLYDTSGVFFDSQVKVNLAKGISPLRSDWSWEGLQIETVVDKHGVERKQAVQGTIATQLFYAKQGIITPQMEYVAIRENLNCKESGIDSYITPEFVMKEVAAGRAVIPSNVNHPEAEPMIIGTNFSVKINSNIGNSSTSSTLEAVHDSHVISA